MTGHGDQVYLENPQGSYEKALQAAGRTKKQTWGTQKMVNSDDFTMKNMGGYGWYTGI